MAKFKLTLPWQMAIGLFLGVLVGIIAQDTVLVNSVLKPLGDVFIRLIRMVVVPLVFTTLVAGAAGIADTSKLGRLATKIMLFYVCTSVCAVLIGLLVANLTHPGAGLNIALDSLKAKEFIEPALSQTLVNLIPMNPVEAMSKGNMLQIIIFAIIFGFGISALGEKAKPLHTFFELCGEAMIKVTGFVMYYAPIGVFGLMAFTVSKHGLDILLPLAKVIGVIYLACILLFLLVYTPLIKFVGIPIGRFLRGMSEPLIVAFSTCSSAAALPSNMTSAEQLGASRTITSFSMPLGNTINMDGSSIYMGITAIFVAEIFGIDLTFTDQLTIVLMAVIASIGTMGVPGAGLIMISIVFVQVGIPLEGVAIVAGVDRIIDMARTTMNVLGDAIAAMVVSRLEGEFDADVAKKNIG